jgi:hypothetical protein
MGESWELWGLVPEVIASLQKDRRGLSRRKRSLVNAFPQGSALAHVGLAEATVLLQLPQKLPQSPKIQEANRFRFASKFFVFRLVWRRGLEPRYPG